MPPVTTTMRKATFAALFLFSMMVPGWADDITSQTKTGPAPVSAITNPEQQVWRWTNQSEATQPANFFLALDQPSNNTEQITANIDIATDGPQIGTPLGSNVAAADISPDDTRGSITGSLSVPLPLGTPQHKPLNSPTPPSPVVAGPVDALGYIGNDGIFHAN